MRRRSGTHALLIQPGVTKRRVANTGRLEDGDVVLGDGVGAVAIRGVVEGVTGGDEVALVSGVASSSWSARGDPGQQGGDAGGEQGRLPHFAWRLLYGKRDYV